MKYLRIVLVMLTCLKFQNMCAQPFNRYARFDGVDDGFTSNFIVPPGSFTIEFYFRYCKDLFNNRVLFSTDKLSFAIAKDSDYYYNTVQDFWYLQMQTNMGQVTLEGQRPASDEWTHFAVAYNDTFNSITHFIDGVAYDANYHPMGGLEIQTELSVGLPTYFFGSNFKGYVDEMRISSGVRYGTNFIPPSTPFTSDSQTLALWHFDEPDYLPSTIADSSGNGNELTAQNGVTIIQDYNVNTIHGDTLVTPYSSYTYSVDGLPSYFSASWHIVNGSIISNFGDSVKVSWDSLGGGNISINVLDTITGCMVSAAQLATNVAECSASFILYADTLVPHHYYAVNLASGLPPLTYVWSWGDGSFDSIPYPSHTYASAGFYSICLSTQDSTGCGSSLCNDYQLQKMSSAEEENTMVTVDVIANIPTVIRNENVLQSWSLFPNPAAGNLRINDFLSVPTRVSIDLYDILGNHMKRLAENDQQAGEHKLEVDLGKLSDGIYVLKIHAGDQLASKKIVVMK